MTRRGFACSLLCMQDPVNFVNHKFICSTWNTNIVSFLLPILSTDIGNGNDHQNDVSKVCFHPFLTQSLYYLYCPQSLKCSSREVFLMRCSSWRIFKLRWTKFLTRCSSGRVSKLRWTIFLSYLIIFLCSNANTATFFYQVTPLRTLFRKETDIIVYEDKDLMASIEPLPWK